MARAMKVNADRLRVAGRGRGVGVDPERKILRGYVVAQLGPFKSEGRGEFDERSLDSIVELFKDHPLGVKSRFAHPNESNDGLGKFLGRSKDAWKGSTVNAAGEEVSAVRADLHLDASAFKSNPNGNLGEYLLKLAESDPEALSSSLVLRTEREYRVGKDGAPLLGKDGRPLPPLWRPTKLFASDIVDEGDAVDGLLSSEPRWTRDFLAQAERLLDGVFAGGSRQVVEAKALAFLERYLSQRAGPSVDLLRRRLALKAKI